MEGLILLVWITALVLAVVWIILPFAIFGTKPLIREHIEVSKALALQVAETNRLLAAMSPAGPAPQDTVAAGEEVRRPGLPGCHHRWETVDLPGGRRQKVCKICGRDVVTGPAQAAPASSASQGSGPFERS